MTWMKESEIAVIIYTIQILMFEAAIDHVN